jgi:hypothetical protein
MAWRMTETARHLAERVVPEVRTRQWVLSFPFQLRWALAFHHDLVKALRKTERSAPRNEDAGWAALMKHSFGLDVLGCPRAGCKGRLTLVAVIFDRDEVKRLLEHLRLFTEPIPMKSARDPPELWTEAYDFD